MWLRCNVFFDDSTGEMTFNDEHNLECKSMTMMGIGLHSKLCSSLNVISPVESSKKTLQRNHIYLISFHLI